MEKLIGLGAQMESLTLGKPKSKKGELKRAQILSTARHHFLSGGYEELTMRGVASECAMNLKNLQYYFQTKEDLFVGIVLDYYEGTLSLMRGDPEPTQTSSERLTDLEKVILDYWDANTSAIWTQLYCMAHHSPRMSELKVQLYENWCEEIANLLKLYYPTASPKKLNKVSRILTALIDGVVFARTGITETATDFDALEKDVQRASKLIAESELGSARAGG